MCSIAAHTRLLRSPTVKRAPVDRALAVVVRVMLAAGPADTYTITAMDMLALISKARAALVRCEARRPAGDRPLRLQPWVKA